MIAIVLLLTLTAANVGNPPPARGTVSTTALSSRSSRELSPAPRGSMSDTALERQAPSAPYAPASSALTASMVLDSLEKVFKILAYIVGACWIYFNFFKGRTYHPRLELRVSGELCRRANPEFIRIVLQLKNVGLSKVDVLQRGTALRLLVYDQSAKDHWRHLTTLSILVRHQWVEPGELLEEHILHPATVSTMPAVKAEVIVTGKKTMWEASTILT